MPGPTQQRVTDYACGGITAVGGRIHRTPDNLLLTAPLFTKAHAADAPVLSSSLSDDDSDCRGKAAHPYFWNHSTGPLQGL